MLVATIAIQGLLASFPRRTLLTGGTAAALFRMDASANAAELKVGGAIVYGDDSIMSPKSHGTTDAPVQTNLRWGVDRDTADRICCFNRHYAEYAGYWKKTNFLSEVKDGETTYYDSVSGKPLFVAPRGRSFDAFVKESASHGWPSFRDEEVVWENMRVLKNGEAVSVDGTHLGHNLPDRNGNRYCINLVSVAGLPQEAA